MAIQTRALLCAHRGLLRGSCSAGWFSPKRTQRQGMVCRTYIVSHLDGLRKDTLRGRKEREERMMQGPRGRWNAPGRKKVQFDDRRGGGLEEICGRFGE